jgi:predicted nucleotidyltransferase
LNKLNIHPTAYNDVNSFLQVFLDNVRSALRNDLIGMYLFGSLALGDFNPSRSDIDVLVVTRGVLTDNIIEDLKTMHSRLYESGLEWATKLEGAYIPIRAMRVYNQTGPACPLVNKKEFLVARPEAHWVLNRHILYTHGVVITGPPLQTIIDPVQPKQLQQAVLTLLNNNWTPWMYNPDLFNGIGYQPFVVLTMCRSLYTLKKGDVASKLRSAEWVLANSDKKWAILIKQAIEWTYGDKSGNIEQTQEFIRYTLKEAGLIKEN